MLEKARSDNTLQYNIRQDETIQIQDGTIYGNIIQHKAISNKTRQDNTTQNNMIWNWARHDKTTLDNIRQGKLRRDKIIQQMQDNTTQ